MRRPGLLLGQRFARVSQYNLLAGNARPHQRIDQRPIGQVFLDDHLIAFDPGDDYDLGRTHPQWSINNVYRVDVLFFVSQRKGAEVISPRRIAKNNLFHHFCYIFCYFC